MNIESLTEKKNKKGILSKAEIDYFVHGSVLNKFTQQQIVAMIKAIYENGMTSEETVNLTLSMSKSGKTLNFGNRIVLDKHSSGGVSDTTTLVIVPILASLSEGKYDFVKISGGTLGHTGGTLNKLKVLKNIKIENSLSEIKALLKQNNACIMAQSAEFVPADKIFYGLRDKFGLVDSLPLIVSSILSKKIAMGANRILLDIKSGNGAFLTQDKQAKTMAKLMKSILTKLNIKCSCYVTDMNQPLGNNIGCVPEFVEAMEILNGKKGRLTDLCIEFCTELNFLATGENKLQIKQKIEKVLSDGTAFEKFIKIMKSQGAQEKQIRDYKKMHQTTYISHILAPKNGYVHKINTHQLGKLEKILSQNTDSQAGIILRHRLGDKVAKGEVLFDVFYNKKELYEQNIQKFNECFYIGTKTKVPVLIKKVYR